MPELNRSRVIIVSISGLALAAAAPPVSIGNRKAYCRGEVSSQYRVRPVYVTTGALLRARDGSTSVSGTVDMGDKGTKGFRCRYDTRGRFIDVMGMKPDGE